MVGELNRAASKLADALFQFIAVAETLRYAPYGVCQKCLKVCGDPTAKFTRFALVRVAVGHSGGGLAG